MVKPFLILQLRPEDEASEGEFEAFLKFGGLSKSEVHRVRIEQESIPEINFEDYSGIIVGGGPSNVSDSETMKSESQKRFEAELGNLIDEITKRDFPYLGACYGLGYLAKFLGGKVSKDNYSEPVAAVTINLTEAAKSDPLTQGLPGNFRAFAGHKEACQDIPPETVLLASSDTCPVQMVRYKRNIYATQFHAELDVEGIVLRINIYRNAGYFPPEDAENLTLAAKQEEITVPEIIFKRFIARYSQPA